MYIWTPDTPEIRYLAVQQVRERRDEGMKTWGSDAAGGRRQGCGGSCKPQLSIPNCPKHTLLLAYLRLAKLQLNPRPIHSQPRRPVGFH